MIFISTYSNENVGLAQELQRYLQRRQQSFYILFHPLVELTDWRSRLEEYRDGELVRTSYSVPCVRLAPLHYLRCFWTTFWSLVFRAREVDLFIGCSNINVLAAIALRLIFPMRVVYVSTDFSPHMRFQSSLLNWIYSMADRMAYRWATAVWHMYPERGQLKKYKHRTKCYDILDGNNFRQIQRLPADQINRFRLVYIGSINRDCRLEEGIMAVSRLKEEFPNTCLDIISSGDPAYEQRLKDLARKETILDRVTFHGQISDPEVYERLLCQCGLGLSLYQLDENDHAWYCTPLKVYLYAACGIPTILSDTIGPQTRGYLERDGIGVMAARGELAEVIRGVFTDRDRYLDMRARAIRWASQFDWEDKFDKFLSLV